jgi:hypothetical protein
VIGYQITAAILFFGRLRRFLGVAATGCKTTITVTSQNDGSTKCSNNTMKIEPFNQLSE